MKAWQIACDGTSKNEIIAIGVVLVSPRGKRVEISQRSACKGCSNAAEALALIAALEEAKRLGARELAITCDNSILIEQTRGEERTQVPRLAPLYAEARVLLASFVHVDMQWVPRHKNAEADVLARAALGLTPKPYLVRNNTRKTRQKAAQC